MLKSESTRQMWLVTICLFAAMCFCVNAGDDVSGADRNDSQTKTSQVLTLLQKDRLEDALQAIGKAVDSSDEGDQLAAAAAGVHRELMQRTDDERFDLLYAWSMPSEDRKSVRILTTPVPQDAPPSAFARVLGERPRTDSFAISSIGEVRGVFSTGWTLMQAADQAGRLPRLTAELEKLVAQNVPSADVMLLLAKLASRRSNASELAKQLRQRAVAQDEAATAKTLASFDESNIVLAAAALQREELRAASEELFSGLVDLTYGSSNQWRPFLRIAHAVAVQRNRGESDPEVLYRNRLKYWVPATGRTASQHAAGAVDAMWLVHGEHILHLAGAANDVLFCRFPLTGEFDFTCETQQGGKIGTDGGLVYGGLQFEPLGSQWQLSVGDADLGHRVRKSCPFVRHDDERPSFNRVSIRSLKDGPQFAMNLHPMWSDNASAQSSPWLGLRSFGERRPMFRNLKIAGTPVIPRQVGLSVGNQLRGWQSQFFDETQPPFDAAEVQAQGEIASEADWHIASGVIHGTKREAASANPQSWLRYHRPLLDGEAMAYEFFHEPDTFDVHPALGRLAFLIEPNGVRVHWITDGELEWTGLSADNAVLEPLNLRGPRPLPLREKVWNKLKLSRGDGKVTLSLNEIVIYERDVDYDGDHTFGFYRDRTKAAAKIRNVVMTGDWPTALPADFAASPAVAVDQDTDNDGQVINEVVGDEFIATNVRHIRRHAREISATERYEFLSEWVLPSGGHAGFRMAGEFTGGQLGSTGQDTIESYIYDLLDAAEETGKLEQLRDRIVAIDEPRDARNQRAKAALLALIHLQLNEPDAADEAFQVLQSLSGASEPRGVFDPWPETLLVYRGVHQFSGNEAVRDLLEFLYTHRAQPLKPSGSDAWQTHIASLIARYKHLETGGTHASFEAPVELEDWIPVVRTQAQSRGNGCAPARWHRNENNEVHHLSGHDSDFLLYRLPLRGDFEMEGDVGSFSTTQVMAAGSFWGVGNGRDKLDTGTLRLDQPAIPLEDPFAWLQSWVRFRVVVRDGVRSVFWNGRQIFEDRLAEHHDPWIGFRSWWRNPARFRDVRITGTPEIPRRLVLSELDLLTGWMPYFDESIGWNEADWRHERDADGSGQIVGRRRAELRGAYDESLLRYHRPLLEDGSVEYDFFQKPGEANTHPALDRLAFLLEPDGVRLHWITDGKYDRTDVPPDNGVASAYKHTAQASPSAVGLRSLASGAAPLDGWNHVKLSIVGGKVTLELNDRAIAECDLQPTNDRTFGLFHFADETEVRVRNVVMHGGWTRKLPPLAEQELADTTAASLVANLPKLKFEFTHDFAKDGLPDEYFVVDGNDAKSLFSPQDDGVHGALASAGPWSHISIIPRFSVRGDFDIEAGFDRAEFPQVGLENSVTLRATFQGEHEHTVHMIRGRNPNGHYLSGKWLQNIGGGRWRTGHSGLAGEAASGRLRLVRRDEKVYSLYAQGDSTQYRILNEATATAGELRWDGVRLMLVVSGEGRASAVWKDVRIAAEDLELRADPNYRPKNVLYVMNADGSGLKQLTKPMAEYESHGSPDWSPDGKLIALDAWAGRPELSHVFLVNADGTGLKDLGVGLMPTFSPDGQRVAFTWPLTGMAIMNRDGTKRQVVAAEGWGAQWSPNGKWIAYESGESADGEHSANITIIDLATKEKRQLLEREQATRYSRVVWNMEWSPDSRHICFKGNVKDAEYEMAITSVNGSSKGFNIVTQENVHPDFAWHPDGSRILMAMRSSKHAGNRLFLCDPITAKIELLGTQPLGQTNFSAAWSPDGSQIVFVSSSKQQQPRLWRVSKSFRE